jgi:hypothetical protein
MNNNNIKIKNNYNNIKNKLIYYVNKFNNYKTNKIQIMIN